MNTNTRKPIYKSRKMWMTLVGIIINGLSVQYPEYKDVLVYINGLIASYVIGEAVIDAANAPKPSVQAGQIGEVVVPSAEEPRVRDLRLGE